MIFLCDSCEKGISNLKEIMKHRATIFSQVEGSNKKYQYNFYYLVVNNIPAFG